MELPFDDDSFHRVIASEVLEHVTDDESAFAELARVLRPGGRLAVTIPAWLSETVCWKLSSDYHAPAVPGGHVRIYRRRDVQHKLAGAGLAARSLASGPRPSHALLVAEVRGGTQPRSR